MTTAFGLSCRVLLAAVFLSAVDMEAFAQGPPAIPVTVAKPLAKRITQWDEYSGRFQAAETVEVRPRVSGFIEHIHFKDGQIVKVGDLLFTIDQRSFKIAVDTAKAEISRATAQVELQQNEVERAAPLTRTGTVTQRDYEQRLANLLIARAQLQAAEAGLKSAELNLEWTEVRAPLPGRTSDRRVDVGNLVTGGAATSTLLTTIVTLDPIHFIFDASEADYMRYVRQTVTGGRKSGREVGHPVRIKLADDLAWNREGRLDFVDNQLNPRSGTIRGRAVFSNADQLFTPGLFARLQLFGGEIDALLLPDSAIVSDQARKIVFTVGADSVVKASPVQLGPIVDNLRVIRSGLNADDRIVIDGLAHPLVRPGAKVVPQDGSIKSASN